MKIFALTIKNSDEIMAKKTITSFIFTKESEAKKMAEEFDKRNLVLKPIWEKHHTSEIKQGLINLKTKAGNYMNGVSRRKWGYKKLHVCDGMTPNDMNKKFVMFTEPEWIVEDKKDNGETSK